ncbi:MAG: hypothetical protein ACRDHX_02595 [Chloroflexota bacterium]
MIDAVAAGQRFVVICNGIQIAEPRLLPAVRRMFVPKTELVALAAAGPHVDGKQFLADLDRAVDQDRWMPASLLDTPAVTNSGSRRSSQQLIGSDGEPQQLPVPGEP